LLATVLEAVYLFRVIISMYSPGKDVEAHQSHGRWELLVATLFGVVLLAGMFLIVPVGKQLDTMASQVTISR
jgi:NADH:ubiquinone oxidoreductase subunit 6 (subunit J)